MVAFKTILSDVESYMTNQYTKMRRSMSPREKLHIAPRFLVTGIYFNSHKDCGDVIHSPNPVVVITKLVQTPGMY